MQRNKEPHKKGYTFFKGVLSVFFKVYYNPQIINKENMKIEGPTIICGNHIHIMDQNLAIISTNKMIHYMAKIEYFNNKKVSWFFRLSGCIPVDRKAHDGKALNEAISLLKKGYAVGLFPEGTRNKTEKELLPFKKGAVKMAKETNATIIPFAVKGPYRFRSKPTIVIGKPFRIEELSLEEANDKLEKTILKLKKQ